jgi:anti-sigma-K factor RskA
MTAWNISLQQQISSLQHQNALLTQQLAKTYPISGIGPASGATGEVTYLPEQNITVLIVQGLPQLQGTHVYQGWLISGNQPTSIGLLSLQNGVASVDFPGNITNYNAAAVSLEPGPGPSKNGPAGPIVAKGTL